MEPQSSDQDNILTFLAYLSVYISHINKARNEFPPPEAGLNS